MSDVNSRLALTRPLNTCIVPEVINLGTFNILPFLRDECVLPIDCPFHSLELSWSVSTYPKWKHVRQHKNKTNEIRDSWYCHAGYCTIIFWKRLISHRTRAEVVLTFGPGNNNNLKSAWIANRGDLTWRELCPAAKWTRARTVTRAERATFS